MKILKTKPSRIKLKLLLIKQAMDKRRIIAVHRISTDNNIIEDAVIGKL